MKKRLLLNLIILVLALTVLPHCGGGGGGGNTGPSGPTTAVLTLSTALTPTGVIPPNITINGYDVTITLPAGVTVKTSTSGGIDSSVLTASGVATGSAIGGDYAPAVGGTPGTVKIIVGSSSINGFGVGEFCKLTCDIAAGSNPSASDFTQATFAAGGYVHTHLGYPDDTVTDTKLTDFNLTDQLSLTATAVIK